MEKEKKNYSKYRPFLLPVIIFLLIFLTVFLAFIPQVKTALGLHQGITEKKVNLADLTRKEAVLQGLDLYELEKKNELVLKTLPASNRPILVLNSVKALGESKGLANFTFDLSPGLVSTASADPKVKISANEKNQIKLFVAFTGGREQISEFVNDLEKLLPVVKILDLNIESEEEDFSRISLNLVSFYLSLPQSLGSIESQVKNLTPEEEETYTKLEDFKTALPATMEGQFVNSGKENPFVF